VKIIAWREVQSAASERGWKEGKDEKGMASQGWEVRKEKKDGKVWSLPPLVPQHAHAYGDEEVTL